MNAHQKINQQVRTDQLPTSDGDYAGYSIANFQAAFDLLCEDCGGYRKGKEIAEQIIREQVQ